MNDSELNTLLNDYPTLYHMAERGAWESIQIRGLLSTTALLDLYEVSGRQRYNIESCHRPSSVLLERHNLPRAVVRDQIPMNDAGLRRCLPNHLTPRAWYELLNAKVFFWLTVSRLHRLTSARAYRNRSHDVLEIDTRSLVVAHRERISLSPMNSGNTKPYPHPRSEQTFRKIDDYPYAYWRTKRRYGEPVVELAVDYCVPDIVDHVSRVLVMRGTNVEGILFG